MDEYSIKHISPKLSDHIASAPYNFVPLPKKVVTVISTQEQENCIKDCETEKQKIEALEYLFDNYLPDHDSYYPNRHTGYFDVSLTALSPLYIRGLLTKTQFNHQQQSKYIDGSDIPSNGDPEFEKLVKNIPDFFHTTKANIPVIPGSSLRGMIRSLLEIVTYSKVQWVTNKQYFFRTVDKSAVGQYYRRRMGKVNTGFLCYENSRYFIKSCDMVRIDRSLLKEIYEGEEPNKTPKWDGRLHQYQPVWIKFSEKNEKRKSIEKVEDKPIDGFVEGRLVITGDIPDKKKEFVFLLPHENSKEIEVAQKTIDQYENLQEQKSLIDCFQDNDQITQWQQKAFPKDKPEQNCRERNGILRKDDFLNKDNISSGHGEPVFFLCEEKDGSEQLVFFGRARMFRLPYQLSALDLVPKELRQPMDIDLADAMFGFIRDKEGIKNFLQQEELPKQGSKMRAYASRIFVTDAIFTPTKEVSKPEQCYLPIMIPRILATPKPTAFQHYLTQSDPDNEEKLNHYDSLKSSSEKETKETVIRGHKLYWHQGNVNPDNIKEDEKTKKISDTSTQHTRIKPVRPDTAFIFRIYFENLSDIELGALSWVLHPFDSKSSDSEYCHNLGMGKPLGMGAVKLDAKIYLTDRAKRYEKLFDKAENWDIGLIDNGENLSHIIKEVISDKERILDQEAPSTRGKLILSISKFETYLLKSLEKETECRHISELERIKALLKLMQWPGFPAKLNEGCYLFNEKRPNTRYMTIGVSNAENEYKTRPVLPDPIGFDTVPIAIESKPITKPQEGLKVIPLSLPKKTS